MMTSEFENLPYMLYADKDGKVYDHPYFRMVGLSGFAPTVVKEEDLIRVPEFSKLFYIPGCPPIGLDPDSGQYNIVQDIDVGRTVSRCYAVAAFLEPGLVRTHLPAADYRGKSYTLPMWAYTAVGFRDGGYWATGFPTVYNHKWDPRNYDDRELIPAIQEYEGKHTSGPLLEHLMDCATKNHCFAAKNLFLKRWEAPLPVSQRCNAACLGCLSLQPGHSCKASHPRISFRPAREEIVSLAVGHLNQAPQAIVSFGQGCEGEPLTEYKLIADSINEIRRRTDLGTINLNTNGSWPERIRHIARSGLDSIRISLNSARPALYNAYFRPKGYDFTDVVASIALCREMGLYTMINYLVFPGVTDQQQEIEALVDLIRKTGVNFVHLKNLCIDPQLYWGKMSQSSPNSMSEGMERGIGIQTMVGILEGEFPELQLGYFNQPVRG
jgi:wyosine [tRNA(Phe)-imidazoG37] synthetase (radical SAM superfamily)